MAQAGQMQTGVGTEQESPQSSSVASRRRQGMSMLVGFYLLLAAGAAYLAIASPLDAGMKVTREEMGAAWPLTISEGTLRCEVGREITFHHRGTGYSLTPHDKHGAYSDVSRIGADDPAGGKKDLSPLIERGTRLCR